MRFFHGFIITSVCCVVLAGCGYKTDPVYVPDSAEKNSSVGLPTHE